MACGRKLFESFRPRCQTPVALARGQRYEQVMLWVFTDLHDVF